jgi:hypothetical protein
MGYHQAPNELYITILVLGLFYLCTPWLRANLSGLANKPIPNTYLVVGIIAVAILALTGWAFYR